MVGLLYVRTCVERAWKSAGFESLSHFFRHEQKQSDVVSHEVMEFYSITNSAPNSIRLVQFSDFAVKSKTLCRVDLDTTNRIYECSNFKACSNDDE